MICCVTLHKVTLGYVRPRYVITQRYVTVRRGKLLLIGLRWLELF